MSKVGFGVIGVALIVSGLALSFAAEPRRSSVAYVEVDGSVNPGSADFMVRAIHDAEAAGDAALVIRLDTPGGMLDSTRDIVKAELASKIPLIVWVGPSGARAGSAGVFITIAGHVAAMAPATNIGAAHPVSIGPGGQEKQDETMAAKVTNDLAAWAESIATQRGRNKEWVAQAVRESVSVTAERALELKVIDLVAPDLPALLKAVDGRTVELSSGKATLSVANAPIRDLKMTLRERLLAALGDPNIAFLLLGLGMLGLLAELYHPGTVFPGVLGAVALATGLVATRMLPVSAGAVILLLVGGALIAAEFFITSYGALGIAGLICFGLGAFLLIDPTEPGYMVDRDFGIAWSMVLPTLLTVAAMLGFVIWKVTVARTGRQTVGSVALVGEEGVALSDFGPGEGQARLRGEIWKVRASVAVPSGARVRVESVEGLVAVVTVIAPPGVQS